MNPNDLRSPLTNHDRGDVVSSLIDAAFGRSIRAALAPVLIFAASAGAQEGKPWEGSTRYANGTIEAISTNRDGPPNRVATIETDDYVFVPTRDGKMYWAHSPDTYAGWWEMAPVANCIDMTSAGERLFAVTGDRKLFVRDAKPDGAGWSQAGETRGARTIAYHNGWIFCVTEKDELITKVVSDLSENWVRLGSAPKIQELSVRNDILFGVDANGDDHKWDLKAALPKWEKITVREKLRLTLSPQQYRAYFPDDEPSPPPVPGSTANLRFVATDPRLGVEMRREREDLSALGARLYGAYRSDHMELGARHSVSLNAEGEVEPIIDRKLSQAETSEILASFEIARLQPGHAYYLIDRSPIFRGKTELQMTAEICGKLCTPAPRGPGVAGEVALPLALGFVEGWHARHPEGSEIPRYILESAVEDINYAFAFWRVHSGRSPTLSQKPLAEALQAAPADLLRTGTFSGYIVEFINNALASEYWEAGKKFAVDGAGKWEFMDGHEEAKRYKEWRPIYDLQGDRAWLPIFLLKDGQFPNSRRAVFEQVQKNSPTGGYPWGFKKELEIQTRTVCTPEVLQAEAEYLQRAIPELRSAHNLEALQVFVKLLDRRLNANAENIERLVGLGVGVLPLQMRGNVEFADLHWNLELGIRESRKMRAGVLLARNTEFDPLIAPLGEVLEEQIIMLEDLELAMYKIRGSARDPLVRSDVTPDELLEYQTKGFINLNPFRAHMDDLEYYHGPQPTK